MAQDSTCRFEELERDVLAVVLQPRLNEVPWTDIEQIGAGIVDRVEMRPAPRVLIDLSDLNYMGSAIVALVVRLWKTITEHQGQMVVVNRHPSVGEVLEISGLTRKWTVVSTREEALAGLGGSNGLGTSLGENSTFSIALTVAGLLLGIAAVLAFADGAMHGQAATAAGPQFVFGIAVACALIAFACGLIAAARGRQWLRYAAAAVAAVSLVVLIAGIVRLAGGADQRGDVVDSGGEVAANRSVHSAAVTLTGQPSFVPVRMKSIR